MVDCSLHAAFKYEKGEHNVYQVTEATYRSCNSSSGVLAKYESGKDEVNLTELGKYWFICDIAGHCLGGMRFVIDVNESSGTSNTDTTIPPPAKLNNVHAPKMWSMEIHVAFGVLVSFISWRWKYRRVYPTRIASISKSNGEVRCRFC